MLKRTVNPRTEKWIRGLGIFVIVFLFGFGSDSALREFDIPIWAKALLVGIIAGGVAMGWLKFLEWWFSAEHHSGG